MNEREQRSHGDSDESPFVDVRRYLGVVYKRKWIVAAACVVGIALTLLYTSRQIKVYQATTRLVVDPQAPAVFGGSVQEVVQLGANDYWSSQEYYNTQLEVIRSYDLAGQTVRTPYPGTEILPYKDPRLIPPEIAKAMSEDELVEAATGILDGAIGASLIPDTRIVAVSVLHHNPELARDLANAHAQIYMRHNLSLRQGTSADATEFLAPKRDEALVKLRTAEKALLDYKLENNLLTTPVERQVSQATADVERYASAHADARVNRIRIEAIRQQAKEAMTSDVLASPIFGFSEHSTSGARNLKDLYDEEEKKFRDIARQYLEKHEKYQAQKARVEQIHADLVREAQLAMTEIEALYQAALETERKNAAERERAREVAVALQKPNAQIERLERELDRAQKNYDDVQTRVDDIEESRENPVGNVRLHETARTPMIHVYPRVKLSIAVAVVISLLFGLGIAFVLEFLDRTVKTAEDVENAAKVPLLGLIPGLAEIPRNDAALQERDLYVFRNPSSPAAECTRSMRTNILFSGADRKLNTITISSPNPREGKTTSVMYLGTTMAQSGQRVLLIDTDLRRPRLHKSVGIPRGRGVTNLILGDATFEETIKTTEIPNLWVLPCGPTPPNPAELLLTDRFKQILHELSERYDWVILDSPPLNAVTDAVVLSRLSDGAILVVQAGKTTRDDLIRVRRQLADVDANLLGVILNDLDLTDKKHGYYYYAYGYGENSPEEAESAS